ncbi:MAG: FAD-dependent oxidoreductase, partial [Thermomicrobiaceae bacterium]|nr:FAD-dependent oxidoreductase [Thermomicrobiaceae bacterium]
LFVSGSARMDGRRLRDALQRAAQRRGATVLRGDARPVREGDRVTAVEVDGRRIGADAVIVAAGAWSPRIGEQVGVRIPVYPQRGQILHLEVPGAAAGRWPIVLGFHSHYILTFPESRVVAGATREDGAGYDVRMTAGGVHEALSEALRVAPGLASATLREVRIGLRPASPDHLPLLGRAPGLANVYLATGHGPSGLQLGPYSGAAVADLALGLRVDLDLAPYAPGRF